MADTVEAIGFATPGVERFDLCECGCDHDTWREVYPDLWTGGDPAPGFPPERRITPDPLLSYFERTDHAEDDVRDILPRIGNEADGQVETRFKIELDPERLAA